jgi:hypothetical protein
VGGGPGLFSASTTGPPTLSWGLGADS